MFGAMQWRRTLLAAVALNAALLVAVPSAFAGRLIESGHDFDLHCADQDQECNFVKVAVNYVRAGAPTPSRPVLVLDRLDLDVKRAIDKAFGAGKVPMTVVDPRSAAFTTTPIDTAHWSAIFVASDVNCGGCDLNAAPASGAAQTPDSTAIALRTAAMAAFFDAGGGIVAGSGSIDAGGTGGIAFDANNVPYYSFVATAGAGNVTGPFQLTPLGVALGLTDADVNFLGCGAGCTHNSFGFPPAGSRLVPVERDQPSGRFITLIQDTDPPVASVTSGPPSVTTATSARFTFKSSEDKSTFQCRLDGGGFGACSSPRTVSGLTEGRHVMDVRAVDLVGNVQPTPTAYSWSVCLDRDGDGFTSCSSPPDCNDLNRNIRPGGREVTGNKVDENCDDFSAPFGVVDASIRFIFSATASATEVLTLSLSQITPRKTKLTVTCKGGGCPFKSKKVRIKRKRARLAGLFRGDKLSPGATITASITRRGFISKVFRFKVRSAKLPSLDTLCQVPGKRKLRDKCPLFVS